MYKNVIGPPGAIQMAPGPRGFHNPNKDPLVHFGASVWHNIIIFVSIITKICVKFLFGLGFVRMK